MTRFILASLLGSTALVTSALAQSQSPRNAGTDPQPSGTQSSQQNDPCTQLIDALRDMPIVQRPVSMRQARQDRADNDTQACRDGLESVRKTEQPDQNAQVQDEGGQITVRQRQPQISVQRGRPEIFIQQQRPTVTIEVPPPRVTVRMPSPDVNVVSPQGQEQSVKMGRMGQPQVQYESAQPRVVVRQSQQQPQVRFEMDQAGNQNRQQMSQMQQKQNQQKQDQAQRQRQQQPQRTAQDESETPAQPQAATNTQQQPTKQQTAQRTRQAQTGQPIRVDTLLEMSLYDQTGELLGDVERVVRDQGRNSIIIGAGGFLGLGEKQIAVPLGQVYRSGDRLISRSISSAQVEQMTAWSEGTGAELNDQQTVNVGGNL